MPEDADQTANRRSEAGDWLDSKRQPGMAAGQVDFHVQVYKAGTVRRINIQSRANRPAKPAVSLSRQLFQIPDRITGYPGFGEALPPSQDRFEGAASLVRPLWYYSDSGRYPVLQPQTRELLSFLQDHPDVRSRIRAFPDKTLLYAGKGFQAAWVEIAALKRSSPHFTDKETLPDVLRRIHVTGGRFPTLLDWAHSLDSIKPWDKNGLIVWRALSGIFASNAVGAVSFYIGSGIGKDKVFASTELAVLSRNPKVDALTREALTYYQTVLRSKQFDPGELRDVNFGLIRG